MVDKRSALSRRQFVKRAKAGKAGRGEDAFARKESKQWAKIEARIKIITARERGRQLAGSGHDVIQQQRHATHRTLKAIKF